MTHKVTSWEAQNIDDILKSQSGPFAQALAMKYIGRLIEGIEPKSRVMGVICQFFESEDRFENIVRLDFPQKRALHRAREAAYKQARAPYLKDLKVAQKAHKEAQEAYDVATSDDVEALKAELEAAKQKRMEVQDALNSLNVVKPKPYRPRYRTRLKVLQNGFVGTQQLYPIALKADVDYLKNMCAREAQLRDDIVIHPVYKNLNMLGDILGWSALERDIVNILWTVHNCSDFKGLFLQNLLLNVDDKALSFNHILAVMTGASRQEVSNVLSPEGELFTAGVFVGAYSGDNIFARFNEPLLKMLAEPDMTPERLLSGMVGEAATTPLELHKNFNYVSEHIGHLTSLVKNAVEQNLSGFNVLVYGVPDSGKTEFTKALAKAIDIPLYMLAENKEGQSEPTPQERLAKVLLAKRLTSKMDRVILAIDEAEDLLKIRNAGDEKGSGGVTKVFLNRLLERGHMTVWIVNDIDAIHPAVRRRFKYAVPFGALTARDRLAAWQDIAKQNNLDVPSAALSGLAQQYRVPVGSIVTAVENAKLTTGDVGAIKRSLHSTGNFVFGGVPAIIDQGRGGVPYYPELANFKEMRTGHDAKAFRAFIEDKLDRPIPIYAHGPVEAGKKSFFRDLAQAHGYEFLTYDFLDLFQPNGMNAIMQDALGKPVIIAWDNLSVLNQFPSTHQVAGMVNNRINLLMHTLPCMQVFCSNTKDAAPDWLLRQFPIVLKHDYLDAKQIKAAWQLFFGQAEPRRIGGYKALTPGHFATIANRYYALGVPDSGRIEQEMLDVAEAAKGEGAKVEFPKNALH